MKYSEHVKIFASSFGGWKTWYVEDESGRHIDTWDAPTPSKPWHKGIERAELVKLLQGRGFQVI